MWQVKWSYLKFACAVSFVWHRAVMEDFLLMNWSVWRTSGRTRRSCPLSTYTRYGDGCSSYMGWPTDTVNVSLTSIYSHNSFQWSLNSLKPINLTGHTVINPDKPGTSNEKSFTDLWKKPNPHPSVITLHTRFISLNVTDLFFLQYWVKYRSYLTQHHNFV